MVQNLNQADASEEMKQLTSLLQKKAELHDEINLMKIQDSFKKVNPAYKEYKALLNLSKMISRKVSEVKYINELIKTIELKTDDSEDLEKLNELIQCSRIKSKEVESFLVECEEKFKVIQLLASRSHHLSKELEKKKLDFIINQESLRERKADAFIYKDLQNDLEEYNKQIASFKKNIENIKKIKAQIENKRSSNVEKLKMYEKLGPEAIKLQTKILIKHELEKNITNAERQLEIHSHIINKERSRLEHAEKAGDFSGKSKLESVLGELKNKVNTLESRLEVLYRQREDSIPPIKSNPEVKPESSDSSLIASLTGLMSGLNSMRKEKESLFRESLKLKEKLSSILGVTE